MTDIFNNYRIWILLAVILAGYIAYMFSEKLRIIIRSFGIGIATGGIYFTITHALEKNINYFLMVLLSVSVAFIYGYIKIKAILKYEKMYKQEEAEIQDNIRIISEALDEVAYNIKIIKSSTLPFSESELEYFDEVCRMFDETYEAFSERREYEYVASISFMQDVMVEIYDSAQQRLEEYQQEIKRENEEKRREEYKKMYEQTQHQQISRQKTSDLGYFHGCNDHESLKKRYRELCKVYHPDSRTGNTEIFQKVQEEYEHRLNTI